MSFVQLVSAGTPCSHPPAPSRPKAMRWSYRAVSQWLRPKGTPVVVLIWANLRTDRQTDAHTRALFGAARVGPPFCLGRGRVRGRGGGGGRRKAKGRSVRGFPGWFRPGAPAPAVAGVLDVGAELKSWEPLGYVPKGTPVVFSHTENECDGAGGSRRATIMTVMRRRNSPPITLPAPSGSKSAPPRLP